MRVYVRPQQTLSRAMDRVSAALVRFAPPGAQVVARPQDADLQVLHVVGNGRDALSRLSAERYAVIQYCHRTAAGAEHLPELWAGADLVWSYLPTVREALPDLYFAPLGIDDAFLASPGDGERDIGIMTSGYVSGPGAEAIGEAARAAAQCGLSVVHLGPKSVARMGDPPDDWRSVNGIDDLELAALYRRTRWVSGLRHVEGFEMPAIEGLACGSRPILFDRPDMRQWYGDLAVYVPECSRDDLIDCLIPILESPPAPVTKDERARVLRRFNWQRIAAGFWSALEQRARKAA